MTSIVGVYESGAVRFATTHASLYEHPDMTGGPVQACLSKIPPLSGSTWNSDSGVSTVSQKAADKLGVEPPFWGWWSGTWELIPFSEMTPSTREASLRNYEQALEAGGLDDHPSVAPLI